MFRVCLLFIVIEQCLAVSFNLPFVENITAIKIVQAESSVQLKCVINFEKSDHKPQVEWIKVNNRRFEFIEDINEDDRRYNMHTNQSTTTSTSTLNIDNVNLKDSAKYLCLVDNNISISRNASLLVLPRYSFHVVLEGDDAHLTCLPDNYKFDNVNWLRTNRFPEGSRNSNGSLIIPSSHSSDTGFYSCSARVLYKDVQTIITTIVELKVVPALEVKVRNSKLHRTTGKDVNVTCIIFSLSPINIKWNKDYVPISTPNYKIKTELYKNGYAKSMMDKYITTAQLQVKNLGEADFGVYECLVENEYGFATGTTTISHSS